MKLVNKVFDDDRETRSTEAMKNISELQRTVLGCTDVAGMKGWSSSGVHSEIVA